jgi:phosphatidate cytidylyltransferase
MLKTRLILGSLMAAAAGGVLFFDPHPYYPILLLLALAVGVLATRELVALIPVENRPREWLCLLGVVVLLGLTYLQVAFFIQGAGLAGEVFAAFLVLAFIVEIILYREPGNSITRIAHCFLVVGYLGYLPHFFLSIRWMSSVHSGWMLALAIFVPKCCDIGAYFTGRIFGKHPMTSRLSPKKTWEGLAGGLTLAAIVAVTAGQFVPVFHEGILEAVAFGLIVGIAGVLGDLAESLIKRDALSKDASTAVPGFGGVLDVIDSILFAGPVAYIWFAR